MSDWAERAACRGEDPELFYPPRGEVISETAYQLCAGCPVQPQCLEHAIRHESIGYWAGTSALERKKMRRQRGIAVSRSLEAS